VVKPIYFKIVFVTKCENLEDLMKDIDTDLFEKMENTVKQEYGILQHRHKTY
jgi:hypothetical protein